MSALILLALIVFQQLSDKDLEYATGAKEAVEKRIPLVVYVAQDRCMPCEQQWNSVILPAWKAKVFDGSRLVKLNRTRQPELGGKVMKDYPSVPIVVVYEPQPMRKWRRLVMRPDKAVEWLNARRAGR